MVPPRPRGARSILIPGVLLDVSLHLDTPRPPEEPVAIIDRVLMIRDTFAIKTHVVVSTSGSLGGWSVGDAVTRAGIEAEQLGADSLVLEAGAGATVLPALGVQGEQLAGEDPGQGLLLMGRVVHTRGRLPVEEVMELQHCADGPLEALAGVPQVAHDVAVLPPTLDRPGPAQVGGGRGPVMDRPQQMPELVSSHDDAGEAPGVLHDGHAVHLLQPLVHDACPAYVGKPCRAPVTVSIASLPSAHVELGDGDGDVVHGESPLEEEVLAHVGEGGGRVNGVTTDSVPLKIWRGVTAPGNDDACNGDFDAGSLQQLVSEIDAVPERDDISFNGNVVLPV